MPTPQLIVHASTAARDAVRLLSRTTDACPDPPSPLILSRIEDSLLSLDIICEELNHWKKGLAREKT